jgi:flagellin-like hook-associated protein FlgL
VILSAQAAIGKTATMATTISAAPLSVVVKASGTTLTVSVDYTATFSGGKLHIKLLKATAHNVHVTYTYSKELVAGTDYEIQSSGDGTTEASVKFKADFAAASAIGINYTYAGTVGASKYTVNAAAGATKGSVDFTATVTGDVVVDYSASTDSLWGSDTALETDMDNLNAAISTLRTHASTLAANLTVITTRQDWSQGIIDTLQQGADGLTLGDMNEEGANMLALQTRQQLGIQALSLASQANQSIMRLFG